MRWLKLGFWVLFTIAILFVLVWIVGENQEPMTVTLFKVDTEAVPKWQILGACVLIGALTASVFFIVSLVVLETRNIRLTRANKKLMRALEKAGLSGVSEKIQKNELESHDPLTASGPLLDDDSDV